MPASNPKSAIKHYDIVYDDVLDSLMDKVNRSIQEGWKPIGGLVLAVDQQTESGNLFLQALTR